jgi:high-affinity iron transporter
MFPSFLLSLREGLEAALIIGIVLGALSQVKRSDLKSAIWLGAGIAIAVSLVGAVALTLLGAKFEGRAEEIFEGVAMLMAAGILTWMIFWMRSHARTLKQDLESNVRRATLNGGMNALFALAFFSVAREGLELALFLVAASAATDAMQTIIGAVAGLGVAVVLGWLLFTTTRRLSLRSFFRVTNVLLILFAAGLVAHSVHEFNEAGLIPPVVEHIWDTNYILHENSTLGEISKALFGYNGNPSLTEVVAYVGYFLVLWLGIRLSSQRTAVRSTAT